ncbi:hypothetical protein Q5P01_009560 [Channa striata]|uniref:Uncharacterized protein n=1 Tax=Channa striata TaxID=64152 RepID=A0AA88MZ25_CHASR|nr:hypothetical protein Q5P01_009560 [Channa striata]
MGAEERGQGEERRQGGREGGTAPFLFECRHSEAPTGSEQQPGPVSKPAPQSTTKKQKNKRRRRRKAGVQKEKEKTLRVTLLRKRRSEGRSGGSCVAARHEQLSVSSAFTSTGLCRMEATVTLAHLGGEDEDPESRRISQSRLAPSLTSGGFLLSSPPSSSVLYLFCQEVLWSEPSPASQPPASPPVLPLKGFCHRPQARIPEGFLRQRQPSAWSPALPAMRFCHLSRHLPPVLPLEGFCHRPPARSPEGFFRRRWTPALFPTSSSKRFCHLSQCRSPARHPEGFFCRRRPPVRSSEGFCHQLSARPLEGFFLHCRSPAQSPEGFSHCRRLPDQPPEARRRRCGAALRPQESGVHRTQETACPGLGHWDLDLHPDKRRPVQSVSVPFCESSNPDTPLTGVTGCSHAEDV